MKHHTIFSLMGLIVFFGSLAFSQWSIDPATNNPICTATDEQVGPVITGDGSGGAIIAWPDRRSGTSLDIYAQRINSSGVALWTTDGVAICTETKNQYNPAIVSDGAGGAIIAWMDYRGNDGVIPDTSDIYAQRIDASGIVQWATDGVAISTVAGEQMFQRLISDGAGGAIITWTDTRSSTGKIYAQRLNSSGTALWTPDGVAVSTAAGDQMFQRLISDGAGGAIIVWDDRRNGTNSDIYAQRIDASGIVKWTTDGISIITAPSNQWPSGIVSDGSGGAIIDWSDFSKSNFPPPDTTTIYAQRINSAGIKQWDTNGVAISTAFDNQYDPRLVSDGAGGAIITWYVGGSGDIIKPFAKRSAADQDIYAQRINGAGVVQWGTNGVAITTAPGDQWTPCITADGGGGAIIAWNDRRNGIENADLYAQHINASGVVQWTADGTPISTAGNIQRSTEESATSDGAGGIILTWTDFRNNDGVWPDSGDIYASRVFADGTLPIQLSLFNASLQDQSVLLE